MDICASICRALLLIAVKHFNHLCVLYIYIFRLKIMISVKIIIIGLRQTVTVVVVVVNHRPSHYIFHKGMGLTIPIALARLIDGITDLSL